MNHNEWLDKIVNDDLFAQKSDAADINVGDKPESEWEKRMLHTFLGGRENG